MSASHFLVRSLLSSGVDLSSSRDSSPFLSADLLHSDPSLSMLQLLCAGQQQNLLASFLALCQLQSQAAFVKTDNLTLSDKVEGGAAEAVPCRKRPAAVSDSGGGRRAKHAKRLDDDTETNSPVSGMFIKDSSSLPSAEELQKAADELDDTAAFVHVTEQSRSTVAAIPNVIGECVCALCKVRYEDVFRLAQHKCPRIAHEEYRCPECDKMFSCPANLASHRRWHRPRDSEVPSSLSCSSCCASFSSKKHLRTHSCPSSSSLPSSPPLSLHAQLFSKFMPSIITP